MTEQDQDLESFRLRIYHQLSREGRVDRRARLARELQLSQSEVDAAFERLVESRHLVLDGAGEIALAHPFATRDFGFSVKSATTLWWGGCAWDAFAIPHLVATASPSLIATVCPACDTAHAWSVDRKFAPEGSQVAHFLVPMAHVWDDVVHACENQRIFCDESCVNAWTDRTGNAKGSVFSIQTLWGLSSEWYAGRLDRGYVRRQPEEAAEYFRSVGLVGEFWGNEG